MATGGREEGREELASMAKIETREGTKTETKVKVDSETKAETQTDKMLEKKGDDVFNLTMATGGRAENGDEWASQLLSKLCEDVGFSEEEWRLRLRKIDVWNTLTNYTLAGKSIYSGSISDGVCADILGSDTDILQVLPGIKVTESDVISPDEEDDVYKAITSNHPPFYTMNHRHTGKGLHQISVALRTHLEIDPRSKMPVLNGKQLKAKCVSAGNGWFSHTVLNGPALTCKTDKTDIIFKIDSVISLQCPSWPIVSEKWKDRREPSGWPSPELIERVTTFGCEFVPIGNTLSPHNEIEWRMSSSVAERVLIRSFNIVQIQTYFLLKLVLVYLIKPEVPESLCSYHIKNIILWQVEKTYLQTWRRENLAQRFNECLKALYQCLENGILSQYFIPEQNLFYPKIDEEVRTKLIMVVGRLVQEGWRCLLRCAPFTNLHFGCMHKVPRCPCYIRETSIQRRSRNVNYVYDQLRAIVIRIMVSLDESTKNCFDQTKSHIQTLKKKTVENEKYRPSRSSIDIINTAMSNHMGFMMLSVTKLPHGQNSSPINQFLKSAECHLKDNCDVDLTSGRLKLATFYYRRGEFDKCIEIVKDVSLKLTTKTVVLNADPQRQDKYGKGHSLFKKWLGLLSISDDIRDLLRNVSFPVMFSPWEIINAPPAVRDLGFKRIFESPMERRRSRSVVAIDSLVYAYYLLTISFRKINKPDQAEKCLDYLSRVLRRPEHYQVYYPYEAGQLLTHCT